jgi:hypothetical protein
MADAVYGFFAFNGMEPKPSISGNGIWGRIDGNAIDGIVTLPEQFNSFI